MLGEGTGMLWWIVADGVRSGDTPGVDGTASTEASADWDPNVGEVGLTDGDPTALQATIPLSSESDTMSACHLVADRSLVIGRPFG
jgi:hypothetical protein